MSLPTSERPREKLIMHGASALSIRELIAILFRTGSRNKDVMSLTNELLNQCDELEDLLYMSVPEIMNVDGIGIAKATSLVAAFELAKRIRPMREKFRINSPADAYDYLHPKMQDLDVEEFHVLLLNTKNEITSHQIVSKGTLNASIVHPREVFKEAIKRGAFRVYLAHNHPSGDCKPSREDLEITKRLDDVGQLVGITVLDHIIIGYGEYYSFKKEGNL